MIAAPKKVLTAEEYLAVERLAPYKSEFLNGQMFAMAGVIRNHNAIKDNLVIEIGNRLKGGPCRTYSRRRPNRSPARRDNSHRS